MDAYTSELKKLLADHQVRKVMRSMIETLEVASKSSPRLKAEIEPLQSEVIMLSSRFTRIKSERKQNLIDQQEMGIELARIEKSLLDTLYRLDENYPNLEKYFQEKDEDAAWAIASAANDIQTYETFFNKYPNGKYKTETQRIIKELKSLEVQKNVEIRKTAEAERKRRQSVKPTPEPKTQQNTTRYILMALGAVALMVIGYFVIDSFTTPKKSPVERRTDIGRVTEDEAEAVKKEPEIAVAVKQPLKLTSGRQIYGTWRSNQGTIRLMTSGTRVYGEMGRSGMIEAVLDIPSEIIKGVRIEGKKKVSFTWQIEGWTLKGKETWVFADKQTNTSWNGEKIDTKKPSFQHFVWDGAWETNMGSAKFIQKGNTIGGALKGKSLSGRIQGSYDSVSKKFTGRVNDTKTSFNFEVQIAGKDVFKGTSKIEMKVPLVGTQKISGSWTGKKVK